MAQSHKVILAGQAETGAYLASPTFPPYRYSWFRDGSFIADAMSRAGEVESAERFFDWCAGIVEEREGFHAVTLASIRAGLHAWGEDVDLPAPERRLDASLLAIPILEQGDAPLAAIQEHLASPSGGVHRHPEDTYYGGGGEWLLLTAFLGLRYAQLGRLEEARAKLEWIAAHATPEGHLPEQSHDHLLVPNMLEPWVGRWGPPASPLLWSHAMFLTLAGTLAEAPARI